MNDAEIATRIVMRANDPARNVGKISSRIFRSGCSRDLLRRYGCQEKLAAEAAPTKTRTAAWKFAQSSSSTPAIVAVMNVASDPPSTARMPKRARSARRFGASPPMPPIWIAIDEKFANPQSA